MASSRSKLIVWPLLQLTLAITFAASFAAPQQTGTQTRPSPPRRTISPLTEHLVLISIDGLRADQLTTADAIASTSPDFPNLKRIRSMGAFVVGVESVYPSQTLPSHASVLTGVLPGKHGVVSDHAFDLERGTISAEPHWRASDLHAETIWDAARRAGLVTAAIGYPLTADAEISFSIPPTFAGSKQDAPASLVRRYSTPPSFFDELGTAIHVEPTDLAGDPEDMSGAERRDRECASAAAYLVDHQRPNLVFVRFSSLDLAQRIDGPESKTAQSALAFIDSILPTITEAIARADFETTLLIISNRGAMKAAKAFNPNVVLAKKGLMSVDRSGSIISWRAMAQTLGGSAAVYARDQKAEEDALAVFKEIGEAPDSPLWRIIPRRQATQMGADPRAAFYLEAAPGLVFAPRATGSRDSSVSQPGAGGYLPQRAEMRAIWIAGGKAIKPGGRSEYARIIDVAPTVARLLGLELREARGKVISELIAAP
jgi:predicted AlkP superfamily pyrophosphatase or phosphodiesterase